MLVTPAGLRKGADRFEPAPRNVLASDPTDFMERSSMRDCNVKPHMGDKGILVRISKPLSQHLDPDVVTHANH